MPFNPNFFITEWLASSSSTGQSLSNSGVLLEYLEQIEGSFGNTFSIL